MAEIYGTPGDDVVTVASNDIYHGEAGNDRITVGQWAVGQGGPGDDTLIAAPGLRSSEATAWYWSSQNNILVDFGAGYALDGFGGRDTLIGIYSAHGFKLPGDQGYGSEKDDYFWIGPAWNATQGTLFIDGRGGADEVTVGAHANQDRGDLRFTTTADGRVVRAYEANFPGFVFELHNVEKLQYVFERQPQSWDILSSIDLSHAGTEILLRGASGWQTSIFGAPLTITYGFHNQAPASGAEGGEGFTSLSDAQRDVVRSVFQKLQQQVGANFVEVDSNDAQIAFGINQQSSTRGYAFEPDAYRGDTKAGDVWLDVETANLLGEGQEGRYVLLHEIGHALGLKHPLPETDTSGATVLLRQFETAGHTLMWTGLTAMVDGSWPSWYGGFDLQAMRELYGYRPFATESNTYTIYDGGSASMVIIDDDGYDAISAAMSTVGATIDLNPGSNSSIGLLSDGTRATNNVFVGEQSYIEAAVGSSGDDVLLGNALANSFRTLGGNDIVDGRGGVDTVDLSGLFSGYQVGRALQPNYWQVSAVNGGSASVELRSVERLVFDDVRLALDVTGDGNAAMVAKTLGAVFGPGSVANRQYVGIGLQYMDNQGFNYGQLMQLAIDARLGAAASNPSEVVNLLFSNVTGRLPSFQEATPFVNMLTKEGVTVANLGILAAQTDLNQVNIDLVGISNHGLLYA